MWVRWMPRAEKGRPTRSGDFSPRSFFFVVARSPSPPTFENAPGCFSPPKMFMLPRERPGVFFSIKKFFMIPRGCPQRILRYQGTPLVFISRSCSNMCAYGLSHTRFGVRCTELMSGTERDAEWVLEVPLSCRLPATAPVKPLGAENSKPWQQVEKCPVAAIVPVYPVGTYRRYRGITATATPWHITWHMPTVEAT